MWSTNPHKRNTEVFICQGFSPGVAACRPVITGGGLIAQGRDIAILVCPLVHHKELYISHIDLQPLQNMGNGDIGRTGIAHDEVAGPVIAVRVHDPLHHIRHHIVAYHRVADYLQLDIGVAVGVFSVHGDDIFLLS